MTMLRSHLPQSKAPDSSPRIHTKKNVQQNVAAHGKKGNMFLCRLEKQKKKKKRGKEKPKRGKIAINTKQPLGIAIIIIKKKQEAENEKPP